MKRKLPGGALPITAAAALGFLIAAWYAGAPKLVWDSYIYLKLSETLLLGRYALSLSEPLHIKYPPGYPGLIALLSWLGLSPPQAAAALGVIAAAGSAGFTFALGRRSSYLTGYIAAVLVSINHIFLAYTVLALSDITFTALVTAVFSALMLQNIRGFCAAVVLAAAAALVRYGGLFLLLPIGFFVYSTAQGRSAAGDKRFWLVCLFAFAALGLWAGMLITNSHGTPAYARELRRLSGLGQALEFPLSLWRTGPCLVLSAALGLGALSRKTVAGAALFLGPYVLLHMLWWWYSVRFYLPLLPFLSLSAAAALRAGLESGSRLRAAGYSLILVLAVAEQPLLTRTDRYEPRYHAFQSLIVYEPLQSLERWAREHAQGAVFVVPEPTVYSRHLPAAKRILAYKALPEALPQAGSAPLYAIDDTLHYRSLTKFIPPMKVEFPALNLTAPGVKITEVSANSTWKGDHRKVTVYRLGSMP